MPCVCRLCAWCVPNVVPTRVPCDDMLIEFNRIANSRISTCLERQRVLYRIMLKSEQPNVARGFMPPGPAGTAMTLRLMRQLSLSGARDSVVRDAATSIIKNARVPANDHRGEMDALFKFVRDKVRYVRDPVGVELIQSPRRTLTNLTGDCDDKTTLLAALLSSIGHPATMRFRVIGTKKNQHYSHVYLVARLGKKDVPLDPTPTGVAMGWEFPRPMMKGDFAL